jgi:hypothetical protein
MKVINEKGKLFGIINIIDLCVILILVLLVGAVGYKLVGNKMKPSAALSTQDITFVVKCGQRSPAYANAFKKGDVIFNLTNVASNTFVASSNTFIDSVTSVPADYTTTTVDGKLLTVKHPTLKDIYITIKTKLNTNTPPFKLGIQDIAVAKKFTVKTRAAEIDGFTDSMQIN